MMVWHLFPQQRNILEIDNTVMVQSSCYANCYFDSKFVTSSAGVSRQDTIHYQAASEIRNSQLCHYGVDVAFFSCPVEHLSSKYHCQAEIFNICKYNLRDYRGALWWMPHPSSHEIIIESVDYICRDSADTQYMLIQTNFSKSPKQLTYKPL